MVDEDQTKRWHDDIDDVLRATTAPRVGKDAKLNGKPVRFDHHLINELLRRREVSTENDGIRSKDYDPSRNAGGGGMRAEMDSETGEVTLTGLEGSENTLVESAALRGLSESDEAQWVTNEHGQKVRVENWRGHETPDPVMALAQLALDCLDRMAWHSRLFEKTVAKIAGAGLLADADRKSQGACAACGRTVPHVGYGVDQDRLRSGYCDRVDGPTWSGCYRKWLEREKEGHGTFQPWIKEQMAAAEAERDAELADGPGYQVADIEELRANGTLPAAS